MPAWLPGPRGINNLGWRFAPVLLTRQPLYSPNHQASPAGVVTEAETGLCVQLGRKTLRPSGSRSRTSPARGRARERAGARDDPDASLGRVTVRLYTVSC